MDLLTLAHIGIITKSQTPWGKIQFFASFLGWTVVIALLGVYYSKDKATFKCDANETFSLIDQFCYEHYAEDFNSSLPQMVIASINFVGLIFIWLAFGMYLGPKLRIFSRRTPTADHAENGRQLHMRKACDRENKCISVYCSYLLQIVIRVLFLIAMVVLLLSYQTFKLPESYTCLLTIEEVKISIICVDPYIAEKQHLNKAMLSADIILIIFAAVEALVILGKVNWRGGQATDSDSVILLESSGAFPIKYADVWCGLPVLVPSDAEFVIRYLLRESLEEESNENILHIGQLSDNFKTLISRRTKDLVLALSLPLPFNTLSTDSLYTTVVFQSEMANRALNANTEQLTPGEIFKQDDGDTMRNANNIMIYGCAGVGKTMFCLKLARDWATGVLSLTNGECTRFQFVFLLKFAELNYIKKNISLTRLLSCSMFFPIDEEDCRRIVRTTPSSILIIFDGLEKFKWLSSCTEDLLSYADDATEMPVSAWYAKLVSGRILKGCTVITTTRPDALHALPVSCQHDKVVKLCGFTLEKAREFIGKLLECEPAARDAVFELISSNRGIESLVCIPEICIIISYSFLYKTRMANKNDNQSSTLTEIYEDLLRLHTVLHNPNCHDTIVTQEFPKSVLNDLFALAYDGIKSGKTLFTRRDMEEFAPQGIEPLIRSGLLKCLPPTQAGPAHFETKYCFNSVMHDFLAANHIVTRLSENEFTRIVRTSGMSTKWDTVLQFVAGLLRTGGEEKMRECLHGLQASFAHSDVRSEGEQLLLAARCCFEYNDDSITSSELAASLKGCIDLRACQASAADNRVIIYLLSRCRPGAITSLRMFHSFLGTKECGDLGGLIASRHGPTEELDISNNSIRDNGVESLCQALRGSHCILRHLNLSGNNISSSGIHCLLDTLKECQCQLQTLNLAYSDFDDNNALQLSTMLYNDNFPLKNLSIAGCGIKDPAIKCLLITPSKFCVQDLDLSDNNFTEQGIVHLSEAILTEQCSLRSLKLRGNCLNDDSLDNLTWSLTLPHCKLQRLDLASTAITDTGASYIAKRLKEGDCKLKYLDISDNNFGKIGCSRIAEAVAAPFSVLEELNMQRNGISDLEALRFLNCFKNPKFTSLYLSENHISREGREQLLCSFLKHKFHGEKFRGKLHL